MKVYAPAIDHLPVYTRTPVTDSVLLSDDTAAKKHLIKRLHSSGPTVPSITTHTLDNNDTLQKHPRSEAHI
jgi:hypothetical protein